MPHIREVRWIIYLDEKGEKGKPTLQQRNGNYGCWEDVPIIEKIEKVVVDFVKEEIK